MGSKRVVASILRTGSRSSILNNYLMFSRSNASILHAFIVIFLEYFAWGLLTLPSISYLNKTFPQNTLLMNGLIFGIKGFLSFLSAPLLGALSDIWGRKFFLLITVFFTTMPIPFLKFNAYIYFGLCAFSGVAAVTFSIIFAYVADITENHERNFAYGAVTASFALSLITSPALGSLLAAQYSDDLVVLVATLIALADLAYILFFVPESLPEKLRQKSVSFWETADPFSTIRKAGKDPVILTLCVSVFLSYLPEAGQYSCFFVYLRLVIGFNDSMVSLFIAAVGLISVFTQTCLLPKFIQRVGSKNTIMIGLILETLQLICYGLGRQHWIIWCTGIILAMSSITYPAFSAYVSNYADADKQGFVQGIITGIRSLCSGVGPFVFGLIFNWFNVDLLSQPHASLPAQVVNSSSGVTQQLLPSPTASIFDTPSSQLIPGPPFLIGALFVMIAIIVIAFIPELNQYPKSEDEDDGYVASKFSACTVSPTRSNRGSSSTSNRYLYKSVPLQPSEELLQQRCCNSQTVDITDQSMSSQLELKHKNVQSSSSTSLRYSGGGTTTGSSETEGDSDIERAKKLMKHYNQHHQVTPINHHLHSSESEDNDDDKCEYEKLLALTNDSKHRLISSAETTLASVAPPEVAPPAVVVHFQHLEHCNSHPQHQHSPPLMQTVET